MQVSSSGDLANWMIPGTMVREWVGRWISSTVPIGFSILMEHTDRHGASKLVDVCTLPLTGRGVVNRVITNLAVIDIDPRRGFVLRRDGDRRRTSRRHRCDGRTTDHRQPL